MSGERVVTGIFTGEEGCVEAIAALRRVGADRPRVFSPFASEAIAQALGSRGSPVRRWILLGGLTGCASGFALTIGLSAEYPHVTAGMPIVSIPPFVIIAFELTILVGALSGVAGFLIHGGFPDLAPMPGYDARFTNDRFGVAVRCPADDGPSIAALLRASGATEVTNAPA